MLTNRLTVAGALVVVMLAGACVPAEEELEPLAKDYGPATTMGAIQERGVLRVGLPGLEGLDTFVGTLATEMADTLGVDLETTEAPPDQVHDLLADETIDIGFPYKPLTEQVVRRNAVTDPYLVAAQRILAPAGIDSPSDLEGRPVCVTGDPQVTVEVGEATRGSIQECLEGLRSGDQVAISGLDVALVAILAELQGEGGGSVDASDLQISGDASSTAGLSAFVPTGASDMIAFVERSVSEYEAAGGWAASWDAVFGSYLGAPGAPPAITAEEAAALFPRP